MTDQKGEKKKMDMKKKARVCSICGTRKGHLRQYGLNICRRCFKDNAPRLGFQKYS